LISAEKTTKRKEVKSMKYTKPAIELVSLAVEAIQGSGKNQLPLLDNGTFVSICAYESDE
jgi:hypothetical protein